MEQYTGSRILVEALIAQGVDVIFGYPGGAVLNIYDELYKHQDRIRHILVSHEQHAAHAADGYARATGKVGVCLATSGPGATNLVTGIATAYMDSVPVVAITGNVSTDLLGKDSFQEVDIAGISMPVVKHNWIVKNVGDLAEIVREAFLVARSGRPGPVLIDIPKDITAHKTDISSLFTDSKVMKERAERLSRRASCVSYTASDIHAAARLIEAARFPMIYAGGGVIIADAALELRLFAERLDAPVALSVMALGAISPDHRLCTGMIGMHGTVASNKAAQKADLLIAIGSRFSDRVTSRAADFARQAKVLQFDIDKAEINKNIPTAAHVTGNIKPILRALLETLPPRLSNDWGDAVAAWKTAIPGAHQRKAALHPRFVIGSVAARLGADAIVVTDVGQHQMWTAQFYPLKTPRSFLTSGGLGTMGFGLGAALGAKAAYPERPVVLFTGDGSFRMNSGELATLAAYGLGVLVVVLNNHVLGMVRQWQTLFYEKRFSHTILDRPPDFVLLAQAYRCGGYRAHDKESFLSALESALGDVASGKPALIDADIDVDEVVMPMVPGGKPIDEQIL
jgi:acetolactate synthase-1/2/3 large subunit